MRKADLMQDTWSPMLKRFECKTTFSFAELLELSLGQSDNNASELPFKFCSKHFGKVVTTKTMSYRELVKHMSEHNSIYGEDVYEGVAIKLQSCILEQLLEGNFTR